MMQILIPKKVFITWKRGLQSSLSNSRAFDDEKVITEASMVNVITSILKKVKKLHLIET